MFCCMEASSKDVDSSGAVMEIPLLEWYFWFPLTYTDTAGFFLWITTAKCTHVPFSMETCADAQSLFGNIKKYINDYKYVKVMKKWKWMKVNVLLFKLTKFKKVH